LFSLWAQPRSFAIFMESFTRKKNGFQLEAQEAATFGDLKFVDQLYRFLLRFYLVSASTCTEDHYMDSALTRTVQRYHRLSADSILEGKTVFLVIETLWNLTLSTYAFDGKRVGDSAIKKHGIYFIQIFCLHSFLDITSWLFVCAYATSYIIIIIILIEVLF